MPVSVDYSWEETDSKVLVRVFLKRVKKSAIDVFIADSYVKVHCPPLLWEADLKQYIDVEKTRYFIEEDCTVRISLHKSTERLVWHELKYKEGDCLKRREESKTRAMELYNTNLKCREDQKGKEEKRFFNEHWDLEKQLRKEVEEKVQKEREEVNRDLQQWEEKTKENDKKAEIFEDPTTAIRTTETKTIEINFTPASNIAMPARTRCDDEIYRRSRYKPKSVSDTPFYFKEQGDKQVSLKQWKLASDSYSEALKRDTCFLAALTNRAICWINLHDYDRCIEDCSLALNMLQSTPAADTTGDRFRRGMMKIFARRSSAHCWNGSYKEGLQDLEMAIGYSNGEEDAVKNALHNDRDNLKKKMQSLGLLTTFELSEAATLKTKADRLMSERKWEQALELYTKAVTEQEGYWDAISNRVVALLCLKKFTDAINDCDSIISHCHQVAAALSDGGVGSMSCELHDSDDEDDEIHKTKREASQLIKSNTSHVYALLKAYIRKGSACAGLKDYRGAYEHYELALRIVPYDDDLRADMEALRNKLQMGNVIAASTNKPENIQ
eukprot:TRINITY_DN3828_c2_g2_i1.p1 TRINITY_DN3828_c2_g2~~TRINITY_DN3828_c2_g2_i1.p1  ORF type:complete len:594 (+),score=141.60 TRINITY_DN3828_c2_g2_i1:123-1784(+)